MSQRAGTDAQTGTTFRSRSRARLHDDDGTRVVIIAGKSGGPPILLFPYLLVVCTASLPAQTPVPLPAVSSRLRPTRLHVRVSNMSMSMSPTMSPAHGQVATAYFAHTATLPEPRARYLARPNARNQKGKGAPRRARRQLRRNQCDPPPWGSASPPSVCMYVCVYLPRTCKPARTRAREIKSCHWPRRHRFTCEGGGARLAFPHPSFVVTMMVTSSCMAEIGESRPGPWILQPGRRRRLGGGERRRRAEAALALAASASASRPVARAVAPRI